MHHAPGEGQSGAVRADTGPPGQRRFRPGANRPEGRAYRRRAAAALVGAVVAEVTKSEDGGLGARLLAGSYYGQTVQIWATLFTAAALSGALVGIIGLIGRLTLRRMAFFS